MIIFLLLAVIAAATVIATPLQKRAHVLPDPKTFVQQNGTKWNVKYLGDISFTGNLGKHGFGGDKCRSSFLGGRHIWNCGDCECGNDVYACGFSMGPAFYGTSNVMVINSTAKASAGDWEFVHAWPGDPKPKAPQTQYGMDTSNVAPINQTHGIAYAWEESRASPDVATVGFGNAVVSVTLGAIQPEAKRIGPLLTGPKAIQIGLLAIMRAGDYVYNYMTVGVFGNIVVGRVHASGDAAFDATKYEYLTYASSNTSKPKWVPGIPTTAGVAPYGMTSGDANGRFTCLQYGDVFWNNYFQKYMLLCNLHLDFTFFYLAEQPWGPWSPGYKILYESGSRLWGYGVNAHPSYSPGGNHKELYFSQGETGIFNMFKISFNY